MNPRQIFHTCLLITNAILFCLILSISIIGSVNTPKGEYKVWICSKILTIKKLLSNSRRIDYFDNLNTTSLKAEINYNKIRRLDFESICITEDNFVFDNDTYDEEFPPSSGGGYGGGGGGGGFGGGGGGGGGGGMGGGGGGFRRLRKYYESDDMTDYIYDKFSEENMCINFDTNEYQYMGFAKSEDFNKFIEYDFRSDIKKIFPNFGSYVIGYVCLPVLIGLIIFSITRICYQDTPQKDFEGDACCVNTVKALVILSFLLIFLGFYMYITIELKENKNECEYFQKIDAATFYIDFINDFCFRKNIEKRALLSYTILFPFSCIIFIVGWIYHIYYNLYLKKGYKAKVLGRKNETKEITIKMKI